MNFSGDLTELVAFDAPVEAPNGQGGTYLNWVEQHRGEAAYRYLRGGETVLQARLMGTKTVVVRIWSCVAAREITPEWRMRDVRTGEVFNIRSILPSDDRMWLELTCQSGVAV